MRARGVIRRHAVLVLVSVASAAHADTAQVETGAMIYGDYCSACHGDELRNTSNGVTFDLRRLKPQDRERFLDAVLHGKKQMPPWRGVLETDQIEAVWAYIRATLDR
jgi:mono/diheme cytochrome c family protein